MATADQTVKEVADSRNWLELPRDVTLIILMKLDTLEILESAQFVCKLWYNLCIDPSMWRVIKIHNDDAPKLEEKYQKLLYNIVDRSSSELTGVDIDGFGSDNLISYIAHRSSQLKHLRLSSCSSISANVVIEALNKHIQLAELELSFCYSLRNETVNIIRCCPFLKIFKLNKLGSRSLSTANDDEALAIADSMHELEHLQLNGNSMTNDGLKAILDNCPHLQSLDLRACFHVNLGYLADNLGKRCAQQIKNFRHPSEIPCYYGGPIGYSDSDDDDYGYSDSDDNYGYSYRDDDYGYSSDDDAFS